MTSTSSGIPMRCCILGGTGFIGGQIARAALASGWEVHALRRRSEAVGAIGDLKLQWIDGDISDLDSLVKAMRGCSVVFHAAAYYPQGDRDTWKAVRRGVTGMRNVLRAAADANTERLVFTSSLTTVGPSQDPSHQANETDLYLPGSVRSPYYEVKWAMEMEAARAASHGLPVITVVPTTVFGPGDVKPATGSVLIMAASGRVPVYVDGTLNVVDVRDAAAGHIAAAERGVPGHRYILGGHNMAVLDMLTTITQVAGRRPPRVRLPGGLIRIVAKMGEAIGVPGISHLSASAHWQALDTRLAREELGVAEPIPFEKTCQDALTWFLEHGYLKRNQIGRRESAAT